MGSICLTVNVSIPPVAITTEENKTVFYVLGALRDSDSQLTLRAVLWAAKSTV